MASSRGLRPARPACRNPASPRWRYAPTQRLTLCGAVPVALSTSATVQLLTILYYRLQGGESPGVQELTTAVIVVAAVYRIVLCSILGVTNAIAISEQGMSGVFLLTLIIVVAWLVALWTRFGSGMGVVGAGAARTGSFGLELSGGSGPTSVFHDIGGLAPGQNYQVTAFVRTPRGQRDGVAVGARHDGRECLAIAKRPGLEQLRTSGASLLQRTPRERCGSIWSMAASREPWPGTTWPYPGLCRSGKTSRPLPNAADRAYPMEENDLRTLTILCLLGAKRLTPKLPVQ